MSNELPVKIEYCPIIDAVVEIRFESSFNPNIILGIFYDKLKDHYSISVKNLPILRIPEEFRTKDALLKFRPWYSLELDRFTIMLGPSVCSVSAVKPYSNWKDYFCDLEKIYSIIEESNVISLVHRIGLRYINYFKEDITSDLSMSVKFDNCDAPSDLNISAKINKSGVGCVICFSNNAEIRDKEGKLSKGSILDIDCSIDYSYEKWDRTKFLSDIKKLHQSEKELFFSLLTKSLLDKLKPQY